MADTALRRQRYHSPVNGGLILLSYRIYSLLRLCWSWLCHRVLKSHCWFHLAIWLWQMFDWCWSRFLIQCQLSVIWSLEFPDLLAPSQWNSFRIPGSWLLLRVESIKSDSWFIHYSHVPVGSVGFWRISESPGWKRTRFGNREESPITKHWILDM